MIFDWTQLLQNFTLLDLLKCIRWIGTLTGASEETRKKQHEEAGRFSADKHVFVVFHEINETPSDKRFKSSHCEMYAVELSFMFVRSYCGFYYGWRAGIERNYDHEVLKLMNNKFIEQTIRKCLTDVLQRKFRNYLTIFELLF